MKNRVATSNNQIHIPIAHYRPSTDKNSRSDR